MKKQKMEEPINPPTAKKIPHETEFFGIKLTDNYHWLRDQNWPNVNKEDVIDYLVKENNYTDYVMKDTEKLQTKLFNEMKGRIKEDDQSYPIKKDNYYYYSKISKGQNHSVFVRKKGSMDAEEEILLDENELAKSYKAFDVGALSVSPDHQLLAYSTDIIGEERYTIYIKDLTTGNLFKEQINDTIGDVVWHEKEKGFYYLKLDENWRSNKVFFHRLGTEPKEDILIYNESNNIFTVGIDKSSSKKYLFITASSRNSDEVRFVNLNESITKTNLILERKEDHQYDVDHKDSSFYIRTNDLNKNFRIVTVNEDDFKKDNWKEIVPSSDDQYITNFDLSDKYLVINKRVLGLDQILIIRTHDNLAKTINFPETAYKASAFYPTFESEYLRISYSSLITPNSIFEYDFDKEKLYTRKTQEIPSGYDKNLYQVERLNVPISKDINIPISLVYKKSARNEEKGNPLYLLGYGSYGIAISPSFNTNIISLLDRGFIFAIAHIRGGDDLGYEWYESAKFLNKKNTFQDFIKCAEFLIDNKYTTNYKLIISGGSAGGLLVGNVINERPELFKAAIARVPFVDVLNTMLDETLPLTPGEFKEWGNPKDEEYFHYMKSYSPYENIKKQDYPAILVTAGLTDPRVTYWEPAKWVAKLRDYKTDNNLLLLKTEMDSGHQGQSGRYDILKEISLIYAFVLKVMGMEDVSI